MTEVPRRSLRRPTLIITKMLRRSPETATGKSLLAGIHTSKTNRQACVCACARGCVAACALVGCTVRAVHVPYICARRRACMCECTYMCGGMCTCMCIDIWHCIGPASVLHLALHRCYIVPSSLYHPCSLRRLFFDCFPSVKKIRDALSGSATARPEASWTCPT